MRSHRGRGTARTRRPGSSYPKASRSRRCSTSTEQPRDKESRPAQTDRLSTRPGLRTPSRKRARIRCRDEVDRVAVPRDVRGRKPVGDGWHRGANPCCPNHATGGGLSEDFVVTPLQRVDEKAPTRKPPARARPGVQGSRRPSRDFTPCPAPGAAR